MSDVGLQDLCPCGSGDIYRDCCFLTDVTAPNELLRAAALVRLDESLRDRIESFALSYFGDAASDALDVLPAGLREAQAIEQLTSPWSLYDFPVDGFVLGDWFLDKRGRRLKPNERAWLKAQIDAHLSVWAVLDTEPGRAVRLKSLLSQEERTVFDADASEALVPHDHVLARIVTHDGVSVFCGVHPTLLGPLDGDAVAREARRALGIKRKRVPKYLLRDGETGLLLLDLWQQVLSARAHTSAHVRLENSDGDAVLITTDTFVVKKGRAEAVARRLLTLEGAERERRSDDEDAVEVRVNGVPFGVVFLSFPEDASDSPTVVGYAQVRKDRVVVETNSVERADTLRERIEEVCEDLVTHLGRVHEDPLSEKARKDLADGPPIPRGALVWMKEQHYQKWPDVALPALGGKTPRDAVRGATGRKKVEVLLREFEHREARLPEEQRIDFGFLRRELGLEEV